MNDFSWMCLQLLPQIDTLNGLHVSTKNNNKTTYQWGLLISILLISYLISINRLIDYTEINDKGAIYSACWFVTSRHSGLLHPST